jgi:hypothetical protein
MKKSSKERLATILFKRLVYNRLEPWLENFFMVALVDGKLIYFVQVILYILLAKIQNLNFSLIGTFGSKWIKFENLDQKKNDIQTDGNNLIQSKINDVDERRAVKVLFDIVNFQQISHVIVFL